MSITLTLQGIYRNNKTLSIGVHQPRNLDYIETGRISEFYLHLPDFFTKLKKFKQVKLIITDSTGTTERNLIKNSDSIVSELRQHRVEFIYLSFMQCESILDKLRNGVNLNRTYCDIKHLGYLKASLDILNISYEIIKFKSDVFIDQYTFNVLHNCSNELKIIMKEAV